MSSGVRLTRRATVLLVITTLGLANGGKYNIWQQTDLNFRFVDGTNETVVIQDEPDISNTVRKDQDEEGVLNYNVDLELEKPAEDKVGELIQPQGKSEIFEITVKNFPPSMFPSSMSETNDDSRRTTSNTKAGSFTESQKSEDKNVILSFVPPGSTHEKNEEEVEILFKVTETDKNNNNSSSSPDSLLRGEETENIIIKLFFQKPLNLLANQKNTNTEGSNEIKDSEQLVELQKNPEVSSSEGSEAQPEIVPAKKVAPPTENENDSPVVFENSPETHINDNSEKVENNPEVPVLVGPDAQPEPVPVPAKEVVPTNDNISSDVVSPSEISANESIEKGVNSPKVSAPVEPEAQPESAAAPSTGENQSQVVPMPVETVSDDDENKFLFNRPSPVPSPTPSNSNVSHPPAAEGGKELQQQQKPIIIISNVTNLSLTLGHIKPAAEKSPASAPNTMAVASPDPQFNFPGGLFPGGAGAGQGGGGGGGQPFGGLFGNLFTMMNQIKPGMMPGAPGNV